MQYRRKRSKKRFFNKNQLWIWRGLLAVFAIIFVIASYNFAAYYIRSAKTKHEEVQIRAEIQGSGDGVASTDVAALDIPDEDSDGTADRNATLERAISRNPDTVGVLTAGSDIQTYVVQRDNQYYLTHSFSGEVNSAGAVFMDVCCSTAPRSSHILLHGHNMHDGTMFGKLQDFRHDYYIDVFPVIRFHTPYEDSYYAIFSVFNLSVKTGSKDYFNVSRFDFETDWASLTFAAEAKQRSLVRIPVDVQAEDRLLTLMTCNEISDDGRFAVMARKLRDGEKPEDFMYQTGGIKRDLYYKEGYSHMSGPDVLEMQKALAALGYLKTECDGIYGKQMADAVLAFQSANRLTPDGMVGYGTRMLLLEKTKLLDPADSEDK